MKQGSAFQSYLDRACKQFCKCACNVSALLSSLQLSLFQPGVPLRTYLHKFICYTMVSKLIRRCYSR